MFRPQYTITNTLLANIKRITEIVAALNNQRFSQTVLAELQVKAHSLSAFSSTSIEGNPLPLTDVKRILKNRPEHIRNSEREILNYNKAMISIEEKIRADAFNLNTAVSVEVQKMVTDGVIKANGWGQLRHEPVFVNDPKARKTIYLPPDHADVPALLEELFLFLEKGKDEIDPLILAGLFHKQFVIIHPFLDGNGRTTRLLTKGLLASIGLNTFNLFSFENYYNQNISRYFEEVGVKGSYYEINDQIDFTSWLVYFTDGIIDELLRVQKELEKEVRSPDLKEHHQKLFTLIKERGHITDSEYASETTRSKPARHLDFRKLQEHGLIEQIGKGRATYYKVQTDK